VEVTDDEGTIGGTVEVASILDPNKERPRA